MELGPISRDEPDTLTYVGGWCAPSAALYDLCKVPPLMPGQRITPAPPPTLWQRLRPTRARLSAARYALREAWRQPDGSWEVD